MGDFQELEIDTIDNFKPLEEEEVLYINNPNMLGGLSLSKNDFSGLVLTAGQFTVSIQRNLKMLPELRKILFGEGMEGESLKFGAKGWQSGKIRVKLTVEFCPDEPEIEETLAGNQAKSSEPESPLDDIRRMMKEDDT